MARLSSQERQWKSAPALKGTAPEAASPTLRLAGPSPCHEDKLGVFACEGEVNGRPSCARTDQPGYMLWWCGGKWWVGKREELGPKRGWIKAAAEDAARPDHVVKGTWLAYSSADRQWKAATSLSAILRPRRRAPAAAPAAAPPPPPRQRRPRRRPPRRGAWRW